MLTNWSFWAVVMAAIAIVLSQLPPFRYWFKRSRLDIELYARIFLTHKVGNPNVQAHIIISNIGGRTVRVKSMSLNFTRNNTHVFTLPIQYYLQKPTDKENVLFTPFNLRPDEEWSHIANFLNLFDRDDEKRYRDMESALRQDILEKRRHNPEALAEAEEINVEPIRRFFDEKFSWHPGEYEMTVTVQADKVTVEKSYRFTIFESESDELKSHVNHYKFGARVYWEPAGGVPTGIFVQIHEENT